MAFSLNNPPYSTDNPPIYHVKLGDGVLGKANKNGTILVNSDITDKNQYDSVIKHEKVHLDQMKRGDLDYNDTHVFWKGKTYPRATMKEGSPSLAWEREAYNKTT